MASKRARTDPSPSSSSHRASTSSSSASLVPPLGMNAAQKDRFKEFAARKILKNHCVIDWEVLGQYGLKVAMRRMIGDGPWHKLFSIQEPAYWQTTIAFLSTFKLKHDSLNRKMNNAVEFFANGRIRTYGFYEFIKAMGLYSDEELNDEEFDDLPVILPRTTTNQTFWKDISSEPSFKPSKSKASTLNATSLRVFHYMLVRTIYGKHESPGAVGEQDLVPLYSVSNAYPVNVGILTIFGIRRQTFEKCKGVFVGGLITRILKNLQLWPEVAAPKDVCAEPEPLPHSPFSQWRVTPVSNPEEDVEAAGIQFSRRSTSSLSKGNLNKLQEDMEGMKSDLKVLREEVKEVKENQNGIVTLLLRIAKKLSVEIPSCFSGRSTDEAGQSSKLQTYTRKSAAAAPAQTTTLALSTQVVEAPAQTSRGKAPEEEAVEESSSEEEEEGDDESDDDDEEEEGEGSDDTN